MSDFKKSLEDLHNASKQVAREQELAKQAKTKVQEFIEVAKKERENFFKRHQTFIKAISAAQTLSPSEAEADLQLLLMVGEQKASLYAHRTEYVRRETAAVVKYWESAISEYEKQINTAISSLASGDLRAAEALKELFENPIVTER